MLGNGTACNRAAIAIGFLELADLVGNQRVAKLLDQFLARVRLQNGFVVLIGFEGQRGRKLEVGYLRLEILQNETGLCRIGELDVSF